jgi:hypothetical protein
MLYAQSHLLLASALASYLLPKLAGFDARRLDSTHSSSAVHIIKCAATAADAHWSLQSACVLCAGATVSIRDHMCKFALQQLLLHNCYMKFSTARVANGTSAHVSADQRSYCCFC